MIKPRRWLIGLGTLAIVQLAILAVCNRIDEQRDRAGLPVRAERSGDPGHDLFVERFDGERVLVPARSGRYQLVHFWATWCPPCRKELPTLMELGERERDRLKVWAVSTDQDWAAIQRFLDGSVPPTVVRDATNGAARAYGVTGLPDSYLIDPDGRIRARFAGAQNWTSREMGKILREFMPGS